MMVLLRTIASAVILTVLVIGSAAALAGPLEDAKAAGQIGEQADGSLGVVSGSAPANVRRLVDEINLQRLEEYRAIAKRDGSSLQAAQKVFGDLLAGKARPGEFVRGTDGRWVRKP